MSSDSAPINLTHHFLIAMPGLEDESFARSVVYLCEHSERGALGLIINKPSDITLKGLFDKVDLSLRREDLTPAPEADRATLLRRVSLDLTGLPPTPEEVGAFLADDMLVKCPSKYQEQLDQSQG